MLIVDDHPVVRFGLTAMLAIDRAIDVVGEATDGVDAVAATSETAPDVVIMDLGMPLMDGVEATRRIVTGAPRTGVLILSRLADAESLFAAIRAGARGFLTKRSGPELLCHAVRAVAAGASVFGPELASRVLSAFAAPERGGRSPTFPHLSAREHEILELLAAGLSNSRIARRLVLSEKTVRNNVSAILTKLGVRGRAEAMLRARAAGLGDRRTG